MLAALSGDENMRRAFAENADLHQITADASGVERKVGKTVNFAYVYGSGPGNIAKTCGISVQKAREVIKGFYRSSTRLKEISDRLAEGPEDLDVSFAVGDRVKVNEGPFTGFFGDVTEVSPDSKKLKILVKVFGRDTSMEVDYTQVEKESES